METDGWRHCICVCLPRVSLRARARVCVREGDGERRWKEDCTQTEPHNMLIQLPGFVTLLNPTAVQCYLLSYTSQIHGRKERPDISTSPLTTCLRSDWWQKRKKKKMI